MSQIRKLKMRLEIMNWQIINVLKRGNKIIILGKLLWLNSEFNEKKYLANIFAINSKISNER